MTKTIVKFKFDGPMSSFQNQNWLWIVKFEWNKTIVKLSTQMCNI